MWLAFICRFSTSKTNMLFCPVRLTCGGSEQIVRLSLLDTGAGICHMTYPMWLNMGLDKICWNNNPQVCKLMGINSPEDMTFDTLPLVSTISVLGDGSEVKVYEIRMDKLQLGLPSLGFNHRIVLENITVRLINRDHAAFIVGWNVLKYLEITYSPSLSEAICQLTLTDVGLHLLKSDRKNKINNCMQNMFNYLRHPHN